MKIQIKIVKKVVIVEGMNKVGLILIEYSKEQKVKVKKRMAKKLYF